MVRAASPGKPTSGLALLAACLLLGAACEGEPRPPVRQPGPRDVAALLAGAGAGAPACAPDEAIAALHAAAFHFEHGPAEAARADLTLARELLGGAPGGAAGRILAQLEQVAVLAATDPARARNEIEDVRVGLGEWSCLGASLHRRLHEALPPIPGG